MKKTLKHRITGYSMPSYYKDILTGNHCGCFAEMTILYDDRGYLFTYETGRHTKLDFKKLETQEKLKLIESLIKMAERIDRHLISPGTYMIDFDLIYSLGDSANEDRLKLLFYPDLKGQPFREKLSTFTVKLLGAGSEYERSLMQQITDFINAEDDAMLRRYLVRHTRV
jgi:hypothetical protein